MEKIILSQTRPQEFFDMDLTSEVWDKELLFERGKNYLIEAESGTGKSSLFGYLFGYRTDYLGKIRFDEEDISGIGPRVWNEIRRTKLSLLFQELRLFPELTAFENIQLKNQLTHHKTELEINEMLDFLGVADKRDALCSKMSWGQRQRVAIIRALCQPFRFLFCDEPVSHLDDRNAGAVAALVASEADRQGAAVIVSSIGKQLPLSYHHRFAL